VDEDVNDEIDERIYTVARRCVESEFPPDFVGRLDRLIVFKRIQRKHLPALLDRALANVMASFYEKSNPGVEIAIDDALREFILKKAERRLHLGARPLMRNVRKYVTFPLADLAVSGALVSGCKLTLSIEDGRSVARFIYRHQIESEPEQMILLPTRPRRSTA